jgi:glycerol-3-phosphate cytidylyltransferase
MRILYTGGTFDIFHFGHVNFLQKCKLISDRVIVALNTDEFIQTYKGKPPIMTYAERERSLLQCQYVDGVVPNIGGVDSRPSILEVQPTIIAIGSDWTKKDYYKQMSFTQEWLDKHNMVLVYIPYTEGISTSEIKRRLIT